RRERNHVALLELPPAGGRTEVGAPLHDDQQLLVAEVVVVRVSGAVGRDLVEAGAKSLAARPPPELRSPEGEAGPRLLVVELRIEQIGRIGGHFAQRPSKLGFRFSRNATIPSTRSSVAIASSQSRRSCASAAASGISSAASTACFPRRTASGGRRAITSASFTASSSQ